jgi:hypothetical protein
MFAKNIRVGSRKIEVSCVGPAGVGIFLPMFFVYIYIAQYSPVLDQMCS